MEMNIWRAPTDNDRVVKRLWYEAGYDKMTQRAYDTTVEALEDGSLNCKHNLLPMAPIFGSVSWKLMQNGSSHRMESSDPAWRLSGMRSCVAMYSE